MVLINQEDIIEALFNFAFGENEELEKMFKSTLFYSYSESEKYFEAMQTAICWAGLVILSSKCNKYITKEELNDGN